MLEGVKAVTALDLLYTAATRSLTVSWRATGETGQIISGQTGI
jgi:hypothetical protein